MTDIKIVCAWCGVVLAEGDEPVSHGICQPCKARLEETDAELLQRRSIVPQAPDPAEVDRQRDSLPMLRAVAQAQQALAESSASTQATPRRFH